jgi:hypothetical protein
MIKMMINQSKVIYHFPYSIYDDVIILALDEAEIALLKSYVSSLVDRKKFIQDNFRELVRMIKQ